MAKIRRVIRKTRPARRPSFDERFWPVMLALFVLGGFVLGTLSAYLDSRGAVWYASSWTWSVLILLIMLLAVWGLSYVDNRKLRRSFQFSAILGVLIHLILLIAALETDIFGRIWEEPSEAAATPQLREPVVEPVYDSVQLASAQSAQPLHVQPLKTDLPDPSKSEVSREETRRAQPPAPVERQAESPAESAVTPSLSRQESPEKTVPRYSEQTGKLSRQQSEAQPQIERLDTEVAPPPPRPAESVAPANSVLQPRRPSSQAQRRESSPSREPVPRVARVEHQRRETRSTPAEPTPSTSLPRSSTEAQIASPAPVQLSRNTSPSLRSLEASETATTRSPSRAAAVEMDPAAPAESQMPLGGSLARAERTDQPAAARLAAARSARRVSAPRVAEAAPIEAAGGSLSRESAVRPQAVAVQRTAVGGSLPAEATSAQVAESNTRPQVPSDAVRAQGQAMPTDPARAASSVERTTRAASSPRPQPARAAVAAERSPDGTDNTAEPARAVLSRSLAGSAGVGQSPNLDRAFPAAESPALVASGAARRAEPSQRMPASTALAPSAPAAVKRSVAGARQPGATLLANTPHNAPRHGAAEPIELNATASASPQQAASNAERGRLTASAGLIDVDLGPTRVVGAEGHSRAAGGGQPELQTFESGRDLPRRRRRTSTASLPATVEVESDATPGDSPQAAQLSGVAPSGAVLRQANTNNNPLSSASPAAAAPGGAVSATAPLSISRSDGTSGGGEMQSAEGALHRPRRSRQLRGPRTGPVAQLATTAGARPQRQAELPGGGSKTDPSSQTARATPAAARDSRAAGSSLGDTVEESSVAGLLELQGTRRALETQPLQRADLGARQGRRPLQSPSPAGPGVVTASGSAVRQEIPPRGNGETSMRPNTPRVARRATGPAASVPLDLDLDSGPGGLGSEASSDAGIASRRASRDSLQIELHPGRFRRQQVGGAPLARTEAVVPTESFRRRATRVGDDASRLSGAPGPETEKAIELGLAFLARHQLPDGSWSLQAFDEDVALGSDTAATGLALLAFQGAGYNHREHKYANVVRAAIDYLVKHQQQNGDLFIRVDDNSNSAVWLYSHGIATLALTESYGMTQDPELAEPAQLAVEFVVSSQDKRHGGWRYRPGFSSDTSVTGWMVMALRSAELANLTVPQSTHVRVRKWMELSQASRQERHLYRYNPFAPNTPTQRHGRTPSPTMTSVGLLMRLYDGWGRDHAAMRRGADYLLEHLPTRGTRQRPQRDSYYWYYGTQVMFHMGGEHWQQWNGRLHPLLVDNQVATGRLAGSWDPHRPVPDRWAPHAGRLYVTTMNLLCLEVFYRHLPIYGDGSSARSAQ